MKIGYFTTAFPFKNPLNGKITKPYIGGGVGEVVYNLAIQLAQKGHEVFIFTSSYLDSEDSIEDYGNIKIFRYKNNYTIGQKLAISINSIYKPIISNITLDIVHVHLGNLPLPLTGYLYSKVKKKPLVITYHADWVGGFGGAVRRIGVFIFNKYLGNILLSNADLIFALSKNQIESSKLLSKYHSKTMVVPNAINLDEFNDSIPKEKAREKLNIPDNKKVILFVGSLNPIKSPHILLESMRIIIKEIPTAYLIILGDGSCRYKLESICHKFDLTTHVQFSGFIADSYTKNLYYRSADIFVLPSKSESFGIVLLEASACGLPLIVSDLKSLQTIVKNGKNGFFSKYGDSNDFANKILCLLNNNSLRERMSENSKEMSTRFSWIHIAEKTESAYKNLLI